MRTVVTALASAALIANVAAKPSASNADVAALLERAGAYLTDFEKDYSRVIVEEHYRQVLKDKRVTTLTDLTQAQEREIESDLLAAPDVGGRWVSFRDVFSVDGRPVRDRDARLEKLFAAAGADRFEAARKIADEGARFNLGSLSRNINLPSMPLTFLSRENQRRSKFTEAGHDRVAGVDVAVLAFEEKAHPTFVRSGTRNVPASGRFWIEPQSGRVMKANVKFLARDFDTELTVTFGLVEKLKLYLPVEMSDVSSNARETVTGFATYSNYRRFDTSVVIK